MWMLKVRDFLIFGDSRASRIEKVALAKFKVQSCVNLLD